MPCLKGMFLKKRKTPAKSWRSTSEVDGNIEIEISISVFSAKQYHLESLVTPLLFSMSAHYITKMTREQIIILVLAFPDLLLRNNYWWHASLFWFYCMNQIGVSIFNGCVWLLFVLPPNDTGAGVFLLKGYACWCSDSLYNQSFYHLLSLTLFSWATCHFRGFSTGQSIF